MRRARDRSKGGAGMIRKLGAIVVLLVIGYVAALVLPVVVSTFRFSQAMDSEVMRGPPSESAGTVRRRLVARAKTLGLNIPEEQIVVQKSGPRYEIDADYVVPLEMIGGFSFDWRFQPHKAGVRRSTAFLR